jgi:hypothetical protein
MAKRDAKEMEIGKSKLSEQMEKLRAAQVLNKTSGIASHSFG